MKNIFVLFFLFSIILTVQVYAATNVSINNEIIDFNDQPPEIVEGRTLVPVRAVFEFIDFEVGWESETQTVTLMRYDNFIEIKIGEPWFIKNGNAHELDVSAQIIGGRTMLPIRALVESIGYYVGWDGETGTVLITNEPPEIVQMEIPPRELTEEEITLWTSNYHALGGATEFEREVIRLTNIEREKEGLEPVAEYQTLMIAARFKAQSLYDLDYFQHTSPVYGHFANIARQVFKMPYRSMGENLARGHQTPEDVVAAWMDSPSHRDNILNANFARIGVGIHNSNWVQKFSG